MPGAAFTARILTPRSLDLPYLVAGNGPLIVLSYILGPSVWGNLDALATQCTVAVIDPRPLSAEQLLAVGRYDWLPLLARDLGFESAVLATWSLGAPSALRYAATRPAALAGLVLVDPAGVSPAPWYLKWRLGRPFSGGPGVSPGLEEIRHLVSRQWRGWVHDPSLDTSQLQADHVALLTKPGMFDANARANAAASTSTLFDAFADVEAPVLLLTGRHSRVLGPAAARRLAARLPRARLVLFDASAHALHLEQPSLFVQTLAEFLTS